MNRGSRYIAMTFAVALAACGDAATEATESTAAPTTASTPATAATTTAVPQTTTTTAEAAATTVATISVPGPLPPYRLEELQALFDPMVEPLGYRVTRGSVFDIGTSEVSSGGTHLALYVEPLDDISFDQFAFDFPELVKVFLPFVFDRWPELTSFDVCQEPFGHQEDTPPSLTLIDLTREAAADVDWQGIDLATLIDLHQVPGIGVWADGGVRQSVAWQNAAEA